MTLQTQQDLANSAANRFWMAHHASFNLTAWKANKTRGQIHEDLKELGATPKIEDVNAAIGNDSWTNINCSHCGESVTRAALLDVTAGEYSTRICESCVDKIKALFT